MLSERKVQGKFLRYTDQFNREMKSILTGVILLAGCWMAMAQPKPVIKIKGKPFVNQAGYNLGEAKRFTVPGAADGTSFTIREAGNKKVVYQGKVKDYYGVFTDFNPAKAGQEYIIQVPGHGESAPFWIA